MANLTKENRVGCERPDGLLNVHSESETCEVCAVSSKDVTPTDMWTEAERDRLRAALEWYAHASWMAFANEDDTGRRAREALAGASPDAPETTRLQGGCAYRDCGRPTDPHEMFCREHK